MLGAFAPRSHDVVDLADEMDAASVPDVDQSIDAQDRQALRIFLPGATGAFQAA